MYNSLIGLDLGTNSVKAILIKEDKIADIKTEGYTPDYLGDGYVEQDPLVWWEATKKVLSKITKANPDAKIKAISCSGQMHSSVFLDSDGEVIRKAILWNDTRTSKQAREVYELVGGEDKMLGYVYNRSLEGFTLPKILWLRENEPDNFKKVDKVIMPKDYINYRLTNRLATDVSDGAGTVLLDVKNKCWSNEMLEHLSLDSSILPEVLNSTDIVGSLTEEAANLTGLTTETLVVAGGADNSCAAIGNGVVKPGQAVISIGTSGTVVAMLDAIKGNVTGDVHLFNYSYPDKYYAMGCMLCAGESLNWLKSIMNKTFDDFNVLAQQASPGSNGLVFLPYLFGERCPVADPDAKGIFFGISGTTSQGDIARAVMEGVAFNIKAMFELVSDFTDVNEIYITGGGAKSVIWGQIISDILGKSISVLNIEEGPAFGAALIAGVGSGAYDSFEQAKEAFLKVEREIKPVHYDIYDKQYQIFLELYKNNKNLF